MDGQEFARRIKSLLESIPGWEGRVFVYIPPVHTESQIVETLTDSSRRINTWFINRTGFSVSRYGDNAGRTPLGYRVKSHLFQLKGFVAMHGPDSEIQFQDLCDRIEEAFAPVCSLGVDDHTVFVRGTRASISYEEFLGVLCHTVIFTFEVMETIRTAYTL